MASDGRVKPGHDGEAALPLWVHMSESHRIKPGPDGEVAPRSPSAFFRYPRRTT
jgi:bifunctional DNase/RNase